MLQPKRTKFKKTQKGRNKGLSINNNINFGMFGLRSIEHGRITSKQIESARRSINRTIKKQGKIWICIFPDKPITKKPLEVRMGKGKGNVEFWVSLIKPGKILYELDGVSEELARKAFVQASSKLPVKTIFSIKKVIL
ncbi:50S ribosomal protein L16 [Enterobacteriaceae bacterium ET-AT1-13]|uniref:Large ribosomal subunit protein uL16m n=1 Tax=Cacopsylla melanoneura TaxID=428564 RepID=A0A8D8WRH1_9HEMI|nr:50S ribosomal protein L16 [Enterobacteriaceae bacterium ET-AT1-13]WGS66335.1 50S ribosomal protein L16 [Enterobacteriaceae bacterium Cmel17]WMC17358.1 MAG: 50S ribosomal protein L16 [Enterobacteriaceae bacterium Cmel21]WMC17565.1 MAG: 50S ribosomal protein L16 [Enterobacteriaceae bacterium PSmelAO3-2]WMC17770.1 MAG: 50S ribosomal protein L16 [Enterobacteriaceae bacterium PSmelAO3-1]WMC17973.1 MAG: 50S ribosomal protein L16 [Enterobacteriaceae bacterium PSmelAO1]